MNEWEYRNKLKAADERARVAEANAHNFFRELCAARRTIGAMQAIIDKHETTCKVTTEDVTISLP